MLVAGGIESVARLPVAGRPTLPDRRIARDAGVAVAADAREPHAGRGLLVEGLLVGAGGEAVPRLPLDAVLLFPDRGEQHLDIHAVAADLGEHVVLGRHLVERLLVLHAVEAMARLPGRAVAQLPDSGIARLAILRIAADARQAIAFLRQAVERRLIVRGVEAVPRLPRRSAAALPDRIEARAGSFAVAGEAGEAIALLHQAVERRLVGLGIDAVPRLPGRAVILLEDRREAGGEARHGHALAAAGARRVVDVLEIEMHVELCAFQRAGRLRQGCRRDEEPQVAPVVE